MNWLNGGWRGMGGWGVAEGDNNMKELWEAITFLCFGFYLDAMFVKSNRTKTSILYLTQLTSYIDMCLTVTK